MQHLVDYLPDLTFSETLYVYSFLTAEPGVPILLYVIKTENEWEVKKTQLNVSQLLMKKI